jgi:DNA primase
MIEKYKVEEILYQYCGDIKEKPGGWAIRCPFCGDSKKNPNLKRCHIDYYPEANEYVFFCYNGGCNESGNIYTLYAHLKGITYKEAKKELDENTYSYDKLKKKFKKKQQQKVKESKTLKSLDISSYGLIGVNSKTFSKREERYQQRLKDFIKERNVDIKCFISTAGKFENRIIIPLYQDNKLVYFQGRRINSTMENKYLNPIIDKSDIIPNIDNLIPDDDIVIAEGILDMYSVGYNYTCCLGAYISDEFLDKIFNIAKNNVIIALDNPKMDEASRKQMNKLIKNSKYGKKLKYFFMPYNDIKDLNQLKQTRKIDNIYNFIKENSSSYFKAKLLLNKL